MRTARVSVTELRTTIPATDLARSGGIIITVANPELGGGTSTNSATVTVLEAVIKVPD